MRLVSVLLILGLCAGMAYAAPGGENEEKPWSYPEGMFGDRDTYPEQEPNDPCGSDQQIACGDVIDYGCMDYVGDRDWYVFTANAGDEITLGTTEAPGQPTLDTYIELYADDCATQLAYDDDGGPGLYSLISGFVAPYTGEYHFMVRSYGDYYTGCYIAFTECGAPPPPDQCDTCEMAEQYGCMIERCTAGSFDGTTADNVGDYSPTNYCTGYSQAAGKDEVYYMDLVAGDVCTFYYYGGSNDKAFYILTDCGDMNSCVVGADDPEEIVGWVAPATGRYYLILDGYSASDQGAVYTLDYIIECGTPQIGACCYDDQTCVEVEEEICYAEYGGYLWIPDEVCDPNPCPPIAAGTTTWGAIKANYR